jgi:hypothetical protein
MCIGVVRRVGGVRLLRKPFPELLNEEDMKRLAGERSRRVRR